MRRKPLEREQVILRQLDDCAGTVVGDLSAGGMTNRRKASALLHRELLYFELCGWVSRLDDKRPIAWKRTPLGTEIMG